jgi:hypothetical protein
MSARGEVEDSRPPEPEVERTPQSAPLAKRVRSLINAVRHGDEQMAREAVLGLSRSQRLLAPLALVVGGVEMLFHGLRLLVWNWRLLLVQVLPVTVLWLAMYDLKAHVLRGGSDPDLRGPVLIPIGLAIVALTVGSFFMNTVFAFAISQPGVPKIRPAVKQARGHLGVIVGGGTVVGVMLALVLTVVSRAHRPWFVLGLGVVVGVMMVGYVAVPARLVGVKPEASRRDKLSASIVAGAIGVAVAMPPYVLGRVGVLMLGVRALFIPGIIVVSIAITLEAGATIAVKAVKMTSKLVGGARSGSIDP